MDTELECSAIFILFVSRDTIQVFVRLVTDRVLFYYDIIPCLVPANSIITERQRHIHTYKIV
jgi:hypothetical protein